jgi:hypothetical protein
LLHPFELNCVLFLVLFVLDFKGPIARRWVDLNIFDYLLKKNVPLFWLEEDHLIVKSEQHMNLGFAFWSLILFVFALAGDIPIRYGNLFQKKFKRFVKFVLKLFVGLLIDCDILLIFFKYSPFFHTLFVFFLEVYCNVLK